MTPNQIDQTQTLNEWDVWVYRFFEQRNFLPTASVFIWDAQERCLILVLTNSANARAKNGGKKAFKPAGGGHHPAEDAHCIVQTAVREAKEELGVPVLQFIGPLCGPMTLPARPTDKAKLKKKGFKTGKAYFGLLFVITGPCSIVRQESEITSVRKVYSRKEWERAIRGNRPKMRVFLTECLGTAEKTGVVQFDKKLKSKKKKIKQKPR